jgi:hypothetical protein
MEFGMRWFQMLVLGVLAGCSADVRVAPQFEAEGRTVAEAEAEGSRCCPPGHMLLCDGRSGVAEPLVDPDSCFTLPQNTPDSEVPNGFSLSADSNEVTEKCDFESSMDGEEDTRRRLATIYCEPI